MAPTGSTIKPAQQRVLLSPRRSPRCRSTPSFLSTTTGTTPVQAVATTATTWIPRNRFPPPPSQQRYQKRDQQHEHEQEQEHEQHTVDQEQHESSSSERKPLWWLPILSVVCQATRRCCHHTANHPYHRRCYRHRRHRTSPTGAGEENPAREDAPPLPPLNPPFPRCPSPADLGPGPAPTRAAASRIRPC